MGFAAAISDDSFDFEAKRKTDGSWHPCRASLSSSASKFEIILDFGSPDEKDVISSKGEAFERLRPRSVPLQNGLCSHIKEGDLVLCMNQNEFKNLYFDAIVQKTHNVRHSSRIHCRCTFEVKWVIPKLDGKEETVPSTSIMKLSDNHISNHQAVAAFFTSSEASYCVEVPSFLGALEEATFESDLQEILERQVEDITTLADGSDNFGDILFGTKQAPLYNKNEFRRTTRSQRKEKVQIEPTKDLDKRPLNPLAACAALASALQVQLSHEPEFSTIQLEEYQHNLSCEGVKKPGHQKFLEVRGTRIVPENKWNGFPNLSRTKDIMHGSSSFNSSAASISTRDVDKSVYEETQSTRSFQDESNISNSAKLVTRGKLKSASVPARLARSTSKNQTPSDPEVQNETLTKKLTSPKSKSVARSRNHEVEDDTNTKQESGKACGGEEQGFVDSSSNNRSWLKEMGNVDTPAKNESKKRTSISSSMDTKTGTSYASSELEEGIISEDGKKLPTKKTKGSSAAPTLRFSPRLRSLASNPPY